MDYESEYSNRARVPEYPVIFERWAKAAASCRSNHRHCELAVAYGPSARQFIDWFWPGPTEEAPIALFIHGGYWRSLDPGSFSHLAEGVNPHGLALAVVGYDLCPQVTIAQITDQIRSAAAFLWRRHRRPVIACGHSAGGHLTACLLATRWPTLDSDLPDDLVPAGLSISGLFDLGPLVHTSMNGDLRLDPASAHQASPLFWEVPPGRTLDAWVGGEESDEFRRQSRAIVDGWAAKGAVTRYVEVPRTNHFTVLDALADRKSDMTLRLAELAGSLRRRR